MRGRSLNDIGEAFDIGSYSTVSSIIERLKVRMHADRKLSRKVEKLKTVLMRQGRPLTSTPDLNTSRADPTPDLTRPLT